MALLEGFVKIERWESTGRPTKGIVYLILDSSKHSPYDLFLRRFRGPVRLMVADRGFGVDFKDLVVRNRSCRCFHEEYRVDPALLREIVDHARYVASGFNLQPLKYILSCDVDWNRVIFPTLTWGGSVKGWPPPVPGERPSAYLIVLTDTKIRASADIDLGVCAQTLLLAAVSKGLGGCMMRGFDQRALRAALDIPDHLAISIVIALGKPAERARIADAEPGADLAFYRGADRVHVVPKRTLKELIYRAYVC